MIPAPTAERLGQLVSEFDLPADSAAKLEAILEALSADHAPTAVNDPSEGVDVHIADSLIAIPIIRSVDHERIADLGSGCGIPGIVIAAALPHAQLFEVDSQRKRCEFVTEMAASAGIDNVDAVWSRAEEWSDGIGSCDVVTARALADLPVVIEYAAPLLKPGGLLLAWKGRLAGGELERGVKAASQLGMTAPEAHLVAPWPGSGTRHLVLSRLEGDVPAGFPRRSGVAAKRPLGS